MKRHLNMSTPTFERMWLKYVAIRATSYAMKAPTPTIWDDNC